MSTHVNRRALPSHDVPPIDPDDLVDATEVAALLGLAHRNSVSVYRHRHADFPAPVVEKSRCVLWLRADVEHWRDRRG
jgi:predicted DNA-binding transcriptional regulator AlpA